MRDTPPDVAARYHQAMLDRTPAERLKMTFEMFSFAKKLVRAGIRHRMPEATPVEVDQQVFLAFYGRDFSPEEREKILARIARYHAERGAGEGVDGDPG